MCVNAALGARLRASRPAADSVGGMEVRIGVIHSPKELSIEVDQKPDEVSKSVDDAVASGDGVLWLTDVKGRRVGIPASRVAYVELESDADAKRVGFGPA